MKIKHTAKEQPDFYEWLKEKTYPIKTEYWMLGCDFYGANLVIKKGLLGKKVIGSIDVNHCTKEVYLKDKSYKKQLKKIIRDYESETGEELVLVFNK